MTPRGGELSPAARRAAWSALWDILLGSPRDDAPNPGSESGRARVDETRAAGGEEVSGDAASERHPSL